MILSAIERPPIFPFPREMQKLAGEFVLDERATILIPDSASARDTALARLLVADAGDRYHMPVHVERVTSVPANRPAVLMGAISNPLVRLYCAEHNLAVSLEKPGPEGYLLRVSPSLILIAGGDDAGAFYGLQSLRQLLSAGLKIPAMEVRDWPHLPFRGIRLYLPGPENMAFFRRFLRDFMALYKYNKVFIEVGGSMRLDRHPEINAGWLDLVNSLHYTERYEPRGPHGVYQNSAHQDTADGLIVEKQQVTELVRFARENFIDVIPEIPSLTHSYYLLSRHRDLAEIPQAEWPDTYCPLQPKSYDLLFDVMEEYIDVMRPTMIHIGHDEWFVPWGQCARCRTHHPGELFAADVSRIHAWLKSKGIRTAMYGDYFIESVRGKGTKPITVDGYSYEMPGALSPEQVRELIPKDILILNWFWQDVRAKDGRGEPNDIKVEEFGFHQIHNNFTPAIENWQRRSARPGVIGGAPSAWAATNEYTFGKDLMHDYLGCINLMWAMRWPAEDDLSKIVQSEMPDARRRLGGVPRPSEDGDPMRPIRPAAHTAPLNPDWSTVKRGLVGGFQIADGAVVVGVKGSEPQPLPSDSAAIPINTDASSILFLHATTHAAANDMSYRYIHNFPDTADLLGWYEVTYADGFVDSVPIRFGVNILPWTWGRHSDVIAKGVNPTSLSYAYWADPIDLGAQPDRPVTFFAFEWVNPRFGKKIAQVRLRGTSGFTDTKGKVTPSNSIVLAAISVVEKRPIPK